VKEREKERVKEEIFDRFVVAYPLGFKSPKLFDLHDHLSFSTASIHSKQAHV